MYVDNTCSFNTLDFTVCLYAVNDSLRMANHEIMSTYLALEGGQ